MPQDFPDVAWARPTGVLNFPDCSPEGQGIPDLGLPNVCPATFRCGNEQFLEGNLPRLQDS